MLFCQNWYRAWSEILSYSRLLTFAEWEQPWWSPVQNSCLFSLVFRIQPTYYLVERVQKKLERLKTLLFAFIINFTLVLSTLTNLLLHLLQLRILLETNQQPQYTMCTNIRRNRQLHFVDLTLSKNRFRVGNSKT